MRIVNAIVDNLHLEAFHKLYKEKGRSPYHPRMMLKVMRYAYMNNVYSCRKIEKLLLRDIHYIWLSGDEKPDFITINRFRKKVWLTPAMVLKITFKIMLRSQHFDIVKIHAITHALGVHPEREWINKYYPDYSWDMQMLRDITLDGKFAEGYNFSI